MTVTNELHVENPAALLDELAPGVYGMCNEVALGWLLIPVLVGLPPGAGNVSRYLDDLPREKNIVFTVVLSPKLAGMLLRRGFRPATFLPPDHEPLEALVRGREGAG